MIERWLTDSLTDYDIWVYECFADSALAVPLNWLQWQSCLGNSICSLFQRIEVLARIPRHMQRDPFQRCKINLCKQDTKRRQIQGKPKSGQVTRESGRVASLLLSVSPSVRPISNINWKHKISRKKICRPVALVACTSAKRRVSHINLPEPQQISPQELGGRQHLFEHWKRARCYKSLQVCVLPFCQKATGRIRKIQ